MQTLMDFHVLARHHLPEFFQHRRQLPEFEMVGPDMVYLLGLAGVVLPEKYFPDASVQDPLFSEIQIADEPYGEAGTFFDQAKHQHDGEANDRSACQKFEPDVIVSEQERCQQHQYCEGIQYADDKLVSQLPLYLPFVFFGKRNDALAVFHINGKFEAAQRKYDPQKRNFTIT